MRWAIYLAIPVATVLSANLAGWAVARFGFVNVALAIIAILVSGLGVSGDTWSHRESQEGSTTRKLIRYGSIAILAAIGVCVLPFVVTATASWTRSVYESTLFKKYNLLVCFAFVGVVLQFCALTRCQTQSQLEETG